MIKKNKTWFMKVNAKSLASEIEEEWKETLEEML